MQCDPLGVNEVLRPRLRRAGGPIEIQLFGQDEDRKRGRMARPRCLRDQHPIQDKPAAFPATSSTAAVLGPFARDGQRFMLLDEDYEALGCHRIDVASVS